MVKAKKQILLKSRKIQTSISQRLLKTIKKNYSSVLAKGHKKTERDKMSQVCLLWTGPDSDWRPSARHSVQGFTTLHNSSSRLIMKLSNGPVHGYFLDVSVSSQYSLLWKWVRCGIVLLNYRKRACVLLNLCKLFLIHGSGVGWVLSAWITR